MESFQKTNIIRIVARFQSLEMERWYEEDLEGYNGDMTCVCQFKSSPIVQSKESLGYPYFLYIPYQMGNRSELLRVFQTSNSGFNMV